MNRGNVIFFIVLSGIISFVSSCKSDTKEMKGGNKPRALSAEGYIVQPRSFSTTYTASGSLLPNEEVEIHPEVSGRVTGIHFKEGSFVKEGQLLVQLYDGEIKALLEKLKAQRELQVKTEERQKALLDIGGISQQEFETTLTQIQSLNADIALAEAQLRATRIIAPFSGNIGIRNISTGAIVTPATMITTLQQTHPLKIDFNLPDQYRNSINPGMDVLFSVTGVNDTMNGRISAIDPGADPVTRTVRVRAMVPNTGNKLVAGSFAQVIIPLESDDDAILIPSRSVIPTTKDKLVAVIRGGKANLATVQLGTRTANMVEVLNGLQPGDTILTTGLMQVKEGMDVKVTKVQG